MQVLKVLMDDEIQNCQTKCQIESQITELETKVLRRSGKQTPRPGKFLWKPKLFANLFFYFSLYSIDFGCLG